MISIKARRTGKSTKRKDSDSAALRKAQTLAKARYRRSVAAAKRKRPPQQWFDQTDCPFTPSQR